MTFHAPRRAALLALLTTLPLAIPAAAGTYLLQPSTLTGAGTRLLLEPFDDGAADAWVLTGAWRVGAACGPATSATPVLAFGSAASCTYENAGARSAGNATFTVPIAGTAAATLTFRHWRDGEESATRGYEADAMQVLASTDSGATWRPLARWDAASPRSTAWESASLALSDPSAPDAGAVMVRFSFDTVDGVDNAHAGWFVDDVEVRADRLPVAAFDAPASEIAVGAGARLADASTDAEGPIREWIWSFGDGTYATTLASELAAGETTLAPFTHVYAAPGSYAVNLTVSDADGARAAATRTITVASNLAPVAAFTAPASAVAGASVTFADASTDPENALATWTWTFGDGAASTARSPTHAFASAGSRTVTLTVTDLGGRASVATREITITSAAAPPPAPAPAAAPAPAPALAAAFRVAPDAPVVGEDARFTDASTPGGRAIVAWRWRFGDGHQSAEPNPVHRYETSGAKRVTLTVTDAGGATATTTRDLLVGAGGPLEARVTWATPSLRDAWPPTPFPGVPFRFLAEARNATGAANVTWTIDGRPIAVFEPRFERAFHAAGTYEVRAIVRDEAGRVAEHTARAIVSPVEALPYFEWSPARPTPLDTVTFTDASACRGCSITNVRWTFPGGEERHTETTTFRFPAAGTYRVTLRASSDVGHVVAGEITRVVTVEAPRAADLPVADFDLPRSAKTGERVPITDRSRNAVAWAWDFGDDGVAQGAWPVHAYDLPGTYEITLRVTGALGRSDSVTRNLTVVENVAPVADFTWARGYGSAIVFEDATLDPDGSIASRVWDAGDGTVPDASVGERHAHDYARPGLYRVTLRACDDAGACSETARDVLVPAEPLPLRVTWTRDPRVAPAEPAAEDATVLRLEAADGATDLAQMLRDREAWVTLVSDPPAQVVGSDGPTALRVLFREPGNHSVRLQIESWNEPPGLDLPRGARGHPVFASADAVVPVRAREPTVAIAHEPAEATTTADARFRAIVDAHGSAAREHAWDFGDGATSTDPEPVHRFARPGNYTVTLRVTNVEGLAGSATARVSVRAGASADFLHEVLRPENLTYAGIAIFIDNTSPAGARPVAWAWDFGDGSASHAQFPFHAYRAQGDYDVTLTVTDEAGATSAVTKTVRVTSESARSFDAPAPAAGLALVALAGAALALARKRA